MLLADTDGYERVAHLAPVALPGGDAAIRNPCRVALTHLRHAGVEWTDDLAPVGRCSAHELELLDRQLERRVACVPTTSMGRLFDAVASLLGPPPAHQLRGAGRDRAGDGRRADPPTVRPYRFALDGPIIDPTPVIRAIVDDLRGEVPVGDIARRFHAAVRDVVVAVARRTSRIAATTGGGAHGRRVPERAARHDVRRCAPRGRLRAADPPPRPAQRRRPGPRPGVRRRAPDEHPLHRKET